MALIGMNMLFVGTGVAGGRVYCEGLLRGLASVDKTNEYLIYTRRETTLPDLPSEQFRSVRLPVSGSSMLWRTIWEYAILPFRIRTDDINVFHGLGTLSPSAKPCPLVLTIHDLIFRHFPQSVPIGHRLFMSTVLPRVALRAERIIVPSQATARDVRQFLKVREDRIRIIPYGAGNVFQASLNEAAIRATLEKYGISPPYIISVCRMYPHKNLSGLLRAFALLVREVSDIQLVLVGERYLSGHSLDRLTVELGLQKAIRFTGFVGNDELQALYSAAELYAFPSLAEGLGLPPFEAMACGTPVVASNASAIPEAVGDAGLLADATDPEAFAAAMKRMMSDTSLRTECRRKGLQRIKEFSWERCARATLDIYRELGAS